MDLEQGIKLTSFTDNEPPELVVDRTMENETGSGNVARWREGVRGPWDPNHGTSQKAKVWSTTKPGSFSETAIPGLWPSSFSKKYCCIYRVPNRLRRVNPEAYTPQMLLIGALQHSKKAEALELSKTDSRCIHKYTHLSPYRLKVIVLNHTILVFCIKYHFKFIKCKRTFIKNCLVFDLHVSVCAYTLTSLIIVFIF